MVSGFEPHLRRWPIYARIDRLSALSIFFVLLLLLIQPALYLPNKSKQFSAEFPPFWLTRYALESVGPGVGGQVG
jgi:hypothetical protein